MFRLLRYQTAFYRINWQGAMVHHKFFELKSHFIRWLDCC